ncbi:hypothetical protein G5I_07240 [Acromyrmex echinatior]|uniref:Uncharacterized protein n=1 Tax=Acromyrmex echinatior TaxID=103372 RepID=F4WN90_ACREC|nr:hypothetical protein G5I_07240 [Acromyrmex echinatior]
MEADIYPRQCVTGSAKSAMMNVLAGINPQCTPPPPSSSTVPPSPAAATSHDPLIFGQVTMIRHFGMEQLNIVCARKVGLFKASSEKTAGDGPEGEGEGRREGGESRRRKLRHTGRGIAAGPAPSKGFHGEPVRYKHVGVFHGIQIRRPRASYS